MDVHSMQTVFRIPLPPNNKIQKTMKTITTNEDKTFMFMPFKKTTFQDIINETSNKPYTLIERTGETPSLVCYSRPPFTTPQTWTFYSNHFMGIHQRCHTYNWPEEITTELEAAEHFKAIAIDAYGEEYCEGVKWLQLAITVAHYDGKELIESDVDPRTAM